MLLIKESHFYPYQGTILNRIKDHNIPNSETGRLVSAVIALASTKLLFVSNWTVIRRECLMLHCAYILLTIYEKAFDSFDRNLLRHYGVPIIHMKEWHAKYIMEGISLNPLKWGLESDRDVFFHNFSLCCQSIGLWRQPHNILRNGIQWTAWTQLDIRLPITKCRERHYDPGFNSVQLGLNIHSGI